MERPPSVLRAVGVSFVLAFSCAVAAAQSAGVEGKFTPEIPRTWDDAAMAALEVPLADPVGSPKHVSSDYYYKIPVRPIYKSYPIYAPGHEPAGYIDWRKQQEPIIVWDDATHRPTVRTEADWIKAGEIVFDSPLFSGGPFQN